MARFCFGANISRQITNYVSKTTLGFSNRSIQNSKILNYKRKIVVF